MDAESRPRTRNDRIRVFIGFWNVQLWLNRLEAENAGTPDARFLIDWTKFPRWLADRAAEVCSLSPYSYEGAHVYASYNPKSGDDTKLRKWLTGWLNSRPGVQVVAKARRPKNAPVCPACHRTISACPGCGSGLAGTVEKGVDAAIATDMIRLAWEETYDVAVLVSSDTDLVPAVEFLDLRGRKVIQAGFPPVARELATACWASFDLFTERHNYRRPS